METETVAVQLLDGPIGERFDGKLISEIAKYGEIVRFGRDSIVFQEMDDATSMYLVLEGRVKLTRYSLDGREVILHLVEPHEFMAEAAVFLGTYPATAISMENSVLLRLRKEALTELMESHPAFMHSIIDALSTWLKRMVEKVNQLTLNDASARLIHYLLACEKESMVELPVKKGELAVMLNMKQATLSRALRRLMNERLIHVNGRAIRLLDRDGLQKAALPPIE